MSLKEFLKIFFNVTTKNDIKPRSKKELTKDKKDLGKELTKALTKIRRLEKKDPEKELADFYNNKYNQSKIIYNARNNKAYDVRSFITFPSVVLTEAKITYPNDSNDTKALKILKWATTNLKYASDVGEYWSFPTDVLHKLHGDCEDGTHLIVSLLRNVGIPAYRIKVCCGWAIHPTNKQRYGHSYPIYLRESDNEWISLDWCFLPNTLPIKNRLKHKEDTNYGSIWFTFNDELSWSQHERNTTGRIKDQEIR